jgi:hypothetical protein
VERLLKKALHVMFSQGTFLQLLIKRNILWS